MGLLNSYAAIDVGDMKVSFCLNFGQYFEDKASPIHFHDFFEIHYVLEGRYYLHSEKHYTVEKGDIVIIPPGVFHRSDRSYNKRVIFNLSILKGNDTEKVFSEYEYYRKLFDEISEL